jgi:hypothetical protein
MSPGRQVMPAGPGVRVDEWLPAPRTMSRAPTGAVHGIETRMPVMGARLKKPRYARRR